MDGNGSVRPVDQMPAAARGRVACRLCGGPSTAAFAVGDLNRGLGPGCFEYRRCSDCGAMFIAEVPGDLARYYAADGYGAAAEELTPELRRREQAKLEMLARFIGPGRLVEIGPGPGLFARVAKAAGYEITAIEMDQRYCDYLENVLGVRSIQSNAPAQVLPTLPPSRAIVMWHVIEHLPDPWQVLARCVENLEPGGVLAVSTPNPDSLQYRLLKGAWAHVDAPRHLQLIPARTLEQGLRRLGMKRALTTTSDPVGRALNRGGWEIAVRRRRRWADGPATLTSMRVARAITLALWGIEGRRLAGAAYTSIFVRKPAMAASAERR